MPRKLYLGRGTIQEHNAKKSAERAEKRKVNTCTILLLSGETVERTIRPYNGAYWVKYLGQSIPVERDTVVEGRQTYKQIERVR